MLLGHAPAPRDERLTLDEQAEYEWRTPPSVGRVHTDSEHSPLPSLLRTYTAPIVLILHTQYSTCTCIGAVVQKKSKKGKRGVAKLTKQGKAPVIKAKAKVRAVACPLLSLASSCVSALLPSAACRIVPNNTCGTSLALAGLQGQCAM